MENSYFHLIVNFIPRTIKNASKCMRVHTEIGRLISKGKLTEAEDDYLDLLSVLILHFEKENPPIPDIHGLELLKFLMEEKDLFPSDISHAFDSESQLSAVLEGTADLTVPQIISLASIFKIPPAAFLPIT